MPGEQKPLSPRELEIIQAAASGIPAREFAAVLGISYDTLRTHRERAIAKLGARSTVHAVAIATREGLIT